MDMKTAAQQAAEARRMLEQARDLMSKEVVTDEDRSEAVAIRERAQKMRKDADLLAALEQEAKALPQLQPEQSAAHETGWKSFGEFMTSVVDAKAGNRDPRLTWISRDAEDVKADAVRGKALSGTSGASGGFLIPTQFIADMQTAMLSNSAILPRVTTIPMSSRTVTLPVLDYTRTLPEGEPRQFGGVQAFYQDESAESAESEPRFREHTLTAHELVVYTEANNSLLADSAVSLDAFMSSDMGMTGALNWKVEYKVLRGNGVGQPLGVLNAPCTIFVERETLNDVEYTDLAMMDEAALPSSRLVWLASISLKSRLRLLKDDADNLIWAAAASGLPSMLLGYPIFFTDKLPRIGGRGDIILADMSYYLFGDRQTPTLDVSTESNFRRNRTAYRLIHRHDGSPWMNAPMTLADTVTQVSPFVALDSAVS